MALTIYLSQVGVGLVGIYLEMYCSKIMFSELHLFEMLMKVPKLKRIESLFFLNWKKKEGLNYI